MEVLDGEQRSQQHPDQTSTHIITNYMYSDKFVTFHCGEVKAKHGNKIGNRRFQFVSVCFNVIDSDSLKV